MSNEKKIIISIGSNNDPLKNVEIAERMIKHILPDVQFSKRTWTDPINVNNTDKFINVLAFAHTSHGKMQMDRAVKYIEKFCRSTKAEHRRGIVKLDIDLLLFGELKLHESDWERDYIKEL